MPFVKGSLKFFNNYTNIKLDNNLIVCDIYELGEEVYLMDADGSNQINLLHRMGNGRRPRFQPFH